MDEVAEARSEQELRAILKRATGPMEALVAGLRLSAKSAKVGIPLTLAVGIVSGVGANTLVGLSDWAMTAPAASTELGSQIGLGVAGFCLLYGLLQFPKRATASRASWWPTLLAAPALLVAISLMVAGSGQARQMGPVVGQLLVMGWMLLWGSFGGAAAAVGWVLAGKAAMDGKPFSLVEALEAVPRRLLDVAGAHGARVHAVTIGMQVLLPGILYALQLAFVDMIAVLDPERPSLRRSGQLTSGMRGRIFRLLLVETLVGQLVSFGMYIVGRGALTSEMLIEAGTTYLMDPSSVSSGTQIAMEIFWAFLTWVTTLALLVLYVEREEQVKAKTELKKLQQQAAG
ncbi:MAG: hypothetical protein H6738_16755 [Alphaproteobacteria bacterium]|nr:hypothetical protein [Alphaproteobacteria bacterium]MCB9698433.1 hypothetical protein [Alphaproteobacteria bacterium]